MSNAFNLVNTLKSEQGEALNINSLLTAVRSREADAGGGPRFSRQRLFCYFFGHKKVIIGCLVVIKVKIFNVGRIKIGSSPDRLRL